MDGVAIGNLESFVIANYYMEIFKHTVLSSAPVKLITWDGCVVIQLCYGLGDMVLLNNFRSTQTEFIQTNTGRELHRDFNHHPDQKRGFLKTFAHRSTLICESEHLSEELKYVEEPFRAKEYSSAEIKRTLYPRRRIVNTKRGVNQFSHCASLPYRKNIIDRTAVC